MAAGKRQLEFRIRISRAEKQIVTAIVKDLRRVRDAAGGAASAISALGSSNIDSKK